MKKSAQLLFSFARDAHENVYVQLGIVQKEIETCKNLNELADYCYAIDRAHELIEDAKKQLWKLREECNALCCKLFIQIAPSEHNIKTSYVTATPSIKASVGIPSRKTNPDGYKKLLEYLKLPEELIQQDVARPNWPGLVEFISSKLAAGEAIPEDCGIDLSRQNFIYKLTLRKRKEVLDTVETVSQDEMQEFQERF